MNAASRKPVRKVSAAVVGGALATIIMWLLDMVVSGQIPAAVPTAIGVLAAALVAYVVPNAETDYADAGAVREDPEDLQT